MHQQTANKKEQIPDNNQTKAGVQKEMELLSYPQINQKKIEEDRLILYQHCNLVVNEISPNEHNPHLQSKRTTIKAKPRTKNSKVNVMSEKNMKKETKIKQKEQVKQLDTQNDQKNQIQQQQSQKEEEKKHVCDILFEISIVNSQYKNKASSQLMFKCKCKEKLKVLFQSSQQQPNQKKQLQYCLQLIRSDECPNCQLTIHIVPENKNYAILGQANTFKFRCPKCSKKEGLRFQIFIQKEEDSQDFDEVYVSKAYPYKNHNQIVTKRLLPFLKELEIKQWLINLPVLQSLIQKANQNLNKQFGYKIKEFYQFFTGIKANRTALKLIFEVFFMKDLPMSVFTKDNKSKYAKEDVLRNIFDCYTNALETPDEFKSKLNSVIRQSSK